MRRFAFTTTVLMKTGSLAVLWLLFATSTYAAPGPRQRGTGRVCDANVHSVRSVKRHHRSFGGPVRPAQRSIAGLTEATRLLKRAASTRLADDDEAIQNDAPAARIDDDDTPIPDLQPLEIVQGSLAPLPRSRPFSRRSPRGPPAAT